MTDKHQGPDCCPEFATSGLLRLATCLHEKMGFEEEDVHLVLNSDPFCMSDALFEELDCCHPTGLTVPGQHKHTDRTNVQDELLTPKVTGRVVKPRSRLAHMVVEGTSSISGGEVSKPMADPTEVSQSDRIRFGKWLRGLWSATREVAGSYFGLGRTPVHHQGIEPLALQQDLLDLPQEFNTIGRYRIKEFNKTAADVIVWAASGTNQVAYDSPAAGILTN
ncbi:hypothetical protein FRC07_004665, partial [Ceratobasidium sp. 392]